jgi:hypothetical protein
MEDWVDFPIQVRMGKKNSATTTQLILHYAQGD